MKKKSLKKLAKEIAKYELLLQRAPPEEKEKIEKKMTSLVVNSKVSLEELFELDEIIQEMFLKGAE